MATVFDARPVELLRVTDLHAFYGESHILHGMDFRVQQGELVTLLGRNGAGRTTTLKAILGLTGRRTGSVMMNGRETIGMPPHRIVQLGIGYCPEERGIFSSLTAEENLMLPPAVGSGGLSVAELYAMALARILRIGARLLLLDEITEGLAPVIVQVLGRVVRQLKERGFTMVLVEQNFRFAAPLADRHYVVEHGRVVDMVTKDELPSSMEKLHRFLGV